MSILNTAKKKIADESQSSVLILNKEQIYDNKIAPLMQQIIDICKAHDIQMIFSAEIPTSENPDLSCTTCLPDSGNEYGFNHTKALQIITADRPSFASQKMTPRVLH